jgi:hypothetical protein
VTRHEAIAVGFAVASPAWTGGRILRTPQIGAQSLDFGLCDSLHAKRTFDVGINSGINLSESQRNSAHRAPPGDA